jgi:hypothetical protein
MNIPVQTLFIFKLIIALAFIILGIVAFFVKDKFEIPSLNMNLFSLLVIIYGIFRLYRVKQFYNQEINNN